ncbi:MAG: O-antigen ligase family protein [Planctomycetes bacterium]|nr:O-antigen ligase family protein [Planctomycetota bacterium]
MSEAEGAVKITPDLTQTQTRIIPLPQPGSWQSLNFWGYWLFSIGAFMLLPACLLGTSPIKICEGLLLLGTLLLRLPLHRLPGFYIALAFALWQVLSVAVNGYFPSALDGTAYNWLCLYAMAYAWQVPWLRRSLFYTLIAAVFLSALVSFLQLAMGYEHANKPFHISLEGRKQWRYSTGLHSVSLTHGFILGCLALLLLNKDVWSKERPWLRYIAVFIAVIAMVASSCRAVTLAFPLALLVMFICGGTKKRGLLVVAGAALVLILSIVLLLWMNPESVEKIIDSENPRFPIWQAATHMVIDNPVVGAGGNEGYRVIFNHYPGSEKSDNMADAHNVFLSITAQYGVPGLLLFLVFMISMCVNVYRRRDASPQHSYGIIAIGIFLCVSGMFEDYIGHSATSICCFACIGLLLGNIGGDSPSGTGD